MSRLSTVAAILSIAVVAADSRAQIKYVYEIDYPLGQKDAYIQWVNSVGSALAGPEELKRIASYDNFLSASPHRIVEFEFDDTEAAGTYFADPDVRTVIEDLVNRGQHVRIHVLRQRGDYTKSGRTARASIKQVHTVDYPMAQKAAYLDWARTVTSALQSPEEVVRITSYDSYYGASPQRVIEFEFDNYEDAGRYFNRPEVVQVFESVVNHGVPGSVSVLTLRSDYAR